MDDSVPHSPGKVTGSAPTETHRRVEDPPLRQRILEITVLSSFAVGQPLLWLVVDNPTFAVAHGLAGFQLIAFGIVVVALPALALGLLASLLAAGPRPLSVWSHRLIVGMLLAAIVAPAINRALGFDQWWALVAFTLLSTLGVLAYTHVATLRTLIRYAVIAPLLLPVLFSFSGPIRPLVRATPVDLPPMRAASVPPVVWLVFDQLPLALLLDSEGELAEDRFPNFARLRSLGTWYPRATSITPNTDTSMTATLTGLYPTPGAPSVTTQYPANAFTLLGGLYEVNSHESVTGLCPETICESVEGRQPAKARLLQDSAIVAGRLLLPDGVADRFLPEIDSQWGQFGAAASGGGSAPRVYREDRAKFLSFVEDLGRSDEPTFHYFHMEKPHEPLLMIPDGRIYDYCSCYYTEEGGRWPDDEIMLAQRLQRYVMQTMYVDHELGLVLDRLEQSGTLDEALILVMSDHGASMIPGNVNRSVDADTADEVFSVPLFIKYPNQPSGTVDPRPASLIDVLPTVMDVLGQEARISDFEGTSLLGEPPTARPLRVLYRETFLEIDQPTPADSELIPMRDRLLPVAENPYLFGPNFDLVGRHVTEFEIGISSLSAKMATARHLTDVDTTSDYVPAHVIGELIGQESPVPLAVAFNGRIAGVGSTYFSKVWRISIMGDPRYLRDGENQLTAYEISDGRLLEIAFDG